MKNQGNFTKVLGTFAIFIALFCFNFSRPIDFYHAIAFLPVFIFLVFFIIIKKADKFLWIWTPALILIYIALTEIMLKIFQIPVTYTVPTEGDTIIRSTVFLGWSTKGYIVLGLFALFTGYLAAFFGVLKDYEKRFFHDK